MDEGADFHPITYFTLPFTTLLRVHRNLIQFDLLMQGKQVHTTQKDGITAPPKATPPNGR